MVLAKRFDGTLPLIRTSIGTPENTPEKRSSRNVLAIVPPGSQTKRDPRWQRVSNPSTRTYGTSVTAKLKLGRPA